MTVESVTYISDLDDTYPASGDDPSEGDNHIRNIKTGLGNTFANFTGAAVTATEAELNLLDGVTATTAEINLLDGATAATGTTLAAADRVIVNDAGTMKQVALSDFETFMESNLDTLALTTLTVGGNTAATVGANTFTAAQTITPVGADAALNLNAPAGYDANIYLRENAVNSFILRNDASTNNVRIYKYNGAGSLVSSWTVDETGNWNLDFGNLLYGGSEVVSLTNTKTLTNKTLTSPVLNTGVSGTAVLDEDDMASDSDTQLATQQSIKAYVDNKFLAFRAYIDTAETGLGGSSYILGTTDLTNVTESYDTASAFTLTNGQFKPAIAGYYKVYFQIFAQSVTSGNYVFTDIKKNGTLVSTNIRNATTSGDVAPSCEDLIHLNGSTDYITFVLRSNDSSWTAAADSTFAFGYLYKAD